MILCVGGSENHGITAWNGILNLVGNRIQGDIVDVEAPHKVINVVNVFLVRFRGKEGFE